MPSATFLRPKLDDWSINYKEAPHVETTPALSPLTGARTPTNTLFNPLPASTRAPVALST